jgi:hypothetical protein
VERTERRWLVVTLGILRCAQNDGRNLQRQVQEQLQKQGQLQEQLQKQGQLQSARATAKAGQLQKQGNCKGRATAGGWRTIYVPPIASARWMGHPVGLG